MWANRQTIRDRWFAPADGDDGDGGQLQIGPINMFSTSRRVEFLVAARDTCGIPDPDAAVSHAIWLDDMVLLQWVHRECSPKLTKHHAYIAARKGHVDVFRWLMANGAPVNVKTVRKAARTACFGILRLLCVHNRAWVTKTTLLTALTHLHLDAVHWICGVLCHTRLYPDATSSAAVEAGDAALARFQTALGHTAKDVGVSDRVYDGSNRGDTGADGQHGAGGGACLLAQAVEGVSSTKTFLSNETLCAILERAVERNRGDVVDLVLAYTAHKRLDFSLVLADTFGSDIRRVDLLERIHKRHRVDASNVKGAQRLFTHSSVAVIEWLIARAGLDLNRVKLGSVLREAAWNDRRRITEWLCASGAPMDKTMAKASKCHYCVNHPSEYHYASLEHVRDRWADAKVAEAVQARRRGRAQLRPPIPAAPSLP